MGAALIPIIGLVWYQYIVDHKEYQEDKENFEAQVKRAREDARLKREFMENRKWQCFSPRIRILDILELLSIAIVHINP